MKQLAPECDVTLVQAEDGSGKGIAMVTAVASRLAAQRLQVNQTLALLKLSPEALGKVQALLRREMELGLKKETQATSSVRMLPTYICATPDGSGEGPAGWGSAGGIGRGRLRGVVPALVWLGPGLAAQGWAQPGQPQHQLPPVLHPSLGSLRGDGGTWAWSVCGLRGVKGGGLQG